MTYETHAGDIFGEPATFLLHPEQFPTRIIKGHLMTDGGTIGRRVEIHVTVTPDGKIWANDYREILPQGYELAAERWPDCERIGDFCPDAGEFDLCNIVPALCGSLAEPAA